VLTWSVAVDVVDVVVTPPEPIGALLFETTRIEITETLVEDPAADDGEEVMLGAADMLEKVGNPVAGMQRDPPQESPEGQQAVTPLNTQVG